MAIKYHEKVEENKPKGIIDIDNGDLEALKSVMEQYGFVDHEALIRYALVALLNAADNKLYIKRDGNVLGVKLSEDFIKKPKDASDAPASSD